jgi:DNA processing protein
MTETEQKYLMALAAFPKFGPVRLSKIKKALISWETAFSAPVRALTAAGLEENIAAEYAAFRTGLNPDKMLAAARQEGISLIMGGEPGYPRLLGEIYDPPLLLYARGCLAEKDEFSLAVVGTRKFTSYGRQATEHLVRGLVEQGLTIVSGLAYGIDTIAHEAALAAGGRTIGVLGCGLDRQSFYPAANRRLADRIVASGGAVLTEFPPGTPPLRHHFPRRNRIIAGLSLGTLVIEAAEKSGALITAHSALEQNREVFALPGSVFSPVSAGPNGLLKEGARPVTAAADIIAALDREKISACVENKKVIPESPAEAEILERLTHEPVHIDELIRQTALDTGLISSTLIIMEMKGLVRNLGNMQYVLAR